MKEQSQYIPPNEKMFNQNQISLKKSLSISLIKQKYIGAIISDYGIIVYSQKKLQRYLLGKNTPEYTFQVRIISVVEIPNTNYIAYVGNEKQTQLQLIEQNKKYVNIYDFVKMKIIGRVKMKTLIKQIKINKQCLVIRQAKSISIINFPDLKPVYYIELNEDVNIIYDLSYHGLTIGHTSKKVGQIVIYNLTVPTDFLKKRTSSNVSKFLRKKQVQKMNNNLQNGIVYIEGFNTQISMIRVSPYGGRVAIYSNQKSQIKIFDSLSNQLIQTFSNGFSANDIIDMKFDKEGKVLGCIDLSDILIFNCKLDAYQEALFKTKQFTKLYQEKNPKSLKSIFSFFYKGYDNQQPFSFYNIQQILQKQKKQIQLQKKKSQSENFESTDPHKKQIPMRKKSTAMELKKKISQKKKIQQQKQSQQIVLQRIHVTNNYQIWFFKDKFIYTLKYDPFNGGKMHYISKVQFQQL